MRGPCPVMAQIKHFLLDWTLILTSSVKLATDEVPKSMVANDKFKLTCERGTMPTDISIGDSVA